MNKRQYKKLQKKNFYKHYTDSYVRHIITDLVKCINAQCKKYKYKINNMGQTSFDLVVSLKDDDNEQETS